MWAMPYTSYTIAFPIWIIMLFQLRLLLTGENHHPAMLGLKDWMSAYSTSLKFIENQIH